MRWWSPPPLPPLPRAALRAGRDGGTLRLVTAAAAVGLALAAVAVTLAGPWDAGQRVAERRLAVEAPGADDAGGGDEDTGAVPAAAVVLEPADGDAGPLPARAALARALKPALGDAALGPGGATGSVVDLTTGTRLFGEGAEKPMPPASTVKLVTGVVALAALGPDHRLATTAVWDAGRSRVVLVGGGDPTLSRDDLARLAERTAAALAERDADRVGVAYDVTLYPTELHSIGPNENIAPITPLQVNAGRLDDDSRWGPAPRATDPAADAAAAFADELAAAGVTVDGEPRRAAAPGNAETLATHRSATLSTLVEDMITHSDNDLAEALARHAAIADGHEGDADGVRRTVADRLRRLDLPRENVRIADGSGLERTSRVTAQLLTATLRLAAAPDRPGLRPVLTGLPVAGFTGTLAERYDPEAGTPTAAGAGLVRAKTGTLTGVNALAGTAVTPGGRILAFAFLADDTTDGLAAETALDTAAATLASCACR